MQIVAQISKGHKIVTETTTYEVLGNMSLRGCYLYKVLDKKTNCVMSISRDDVLQAQRKGLAKVEA